ncbi:MAG TPA: hypothetical protein VMS86_00110, partial [Thermoanaerobaculia bacterium]|nr:hypothetical protein [Thermoanaerobaculia bacterium]
MGRSTLLHPAVVCALVLFGCGEEDPTEPTLAPPERIENPDLRIAITDLPGGFDLVTNAGA